MKYRVTHRSAYAYSGTVDLSYHLLHLTPRVLPYQHVQESRITAQPAPAALSERRDYFGNGVTYLTVSEPHERFAVEMDATVDVSFPAPPPAGETPAWESVRDLLCGGGQPEIVAAAEMSYASTLTPPSADLIAYAEASFTPGRPILEAVRDLTSRIHRDFTFDPGATIVTTPLSEVLQQRRGVCQDFAHLELAALRAMGLAARYVSGYIRTYAKDGGQPVRGSAASHAWVSFFCPGTGWIDVDPTNDLIVGDEHIVLAWGRDYDDVSPVRGVVLGGGEHFLNVAVTVMPLGQA
jgi:transglutaminase-like putative cysteine protease